MQAVALLAGFVLLAMAGYFAVYRLGCFLDSIQQERADLSETVHLRVAASDVSMVPSIVIALKDMRSQHPKMQYTLTLGQASDMLQWLACGDVDVIVVPACVQEGGRNAMPFASLRLGVDNGSMVWEKANGNRPPQNVLWNKEDCPIGVADFIKRLCRQKR